MSEDVSVSMYGVLRGSMYLHELVCTSEYV